MNVAIVVEERSPVLLLLLMLATAWKVTWDVVVKVVIVVAVLENTQSRQLESLKVVGGRHLAPGGHCWLTRYVDALLAGYGEKRRLDQASMVKLGVHLLAVVGTTLQHNQCRCRSAKRQLAYLLYSLLSGGAGKGPNNAWQARYQDLAW